MTRLFLVMALTSGSGWVSSVSTVTDSGTSTPASPDSSACPPARWDAAAISQKWINYKHIQGSPTTSQRRQSDVQQHVQVCFILTVDYSLEFCVDFKRISLK